MSEDEYEPAPDLNAVLSSVRAGDINCVRCGTPITEATMGESAWSWDDTGAITDLQVACRSCRLPYYGVRHPQRPEGEGQASN